MRSVPAIEQAPPPRLLMGPGPVNLDPRVQAALATPMLGQFDPAFTSIMNEVMALYRQVFRTGNTWTFCIDGSARAGIEAALVSLIEEGDTVLVPVFGRFGHLLREIAERTGAQVVTIDAEWGTTISTEEIEAAIEHHRPSIVAVCQGDTSTTMAQPLDRLGRICRRHDALLYVDATATLGGMALPVDEWQIDIATAGLQKCLSGPPGIAPITIGERAVERIRRRHHVERGIATSGMERGTGSRIRSNYFDLGMLMDYWGETRLNHHTEATAMIYAARASARVLLAEGPDAYAARHATGGRSVVAGVEAMGLEVFGDPASKMPNVTGIVIPEGIDGERVRARLLADFGIEIGTSFGPLHGRIWRIGTMGYGCRREMVATCLAALESVLRAEGFASPPGAGTEAALAVWNSAG